MSDKILAFGCDHAGLTLKLELMEAARSLGFSVIDCGTTSEESVDYPDFANKVVEVLKSQQASLGVLMCGTGIGMSMVANRHPKIRAAVCHTELEARLAREHNNANILCLEAFLSAHFSGGRHTQRVEKIG